MGVRNCSGFLLLSCSSREIISPRKRIFLLFLPSKEYKGELFLGDKEHNPNLHWNCTVSSTSIGNAAALLQGRGSLSLSP